MKTSKKIILLSVAAIGLLSGCSNATLSTIKDLGSRDPANVDRGTQKIMSLFQSKEEQQQTLNDAINKEQDKKLQEEFIKIDTIITDVSKGLTTYAPEQGLYVNLISREQDSFGNKITKQICKIQAMAMNAEGLEEYYAEAAKLTLEENKKDNAQTDMSLGFFWKSYVSGLSGGGNLPTNFNFNHLNIQTNAAKISGGLSFEALGIRLNRYFGSNESTLDKYLLMRAFLLESGFSEIFVFNDRFSLSNKGIKNCLLKESTAVVFHHLVNNALKNAKSMKLIEKLFTQKENEITDYMMSYAGTKNRYLKMKNYLSNLESKQYSQDEQRCMIANKNELFPNTLSWCKSKGLLK